MLWDYRCDKDHVEEHWTTDRRWQPLCKECNGIMQRQVGGTGMLYFEEGRGRIHIGLSDKPITSYAQREKLMRQHGVVEGNGTVPPSVAKNPKSPALQEYMSRDKRGRWL